MNSRERANAVTLWVTVDASSTHTLSGGTSMLSNVPVRTIPPGRYTTIGSSLSATISPWSHWVVVPGAAGAACTSALRLTPVAGAKEIEPSEWVTGRPG